MSLLRAKDFFKGAPTLVLRMSHSFTAYAIFSSTVLHVLLALVLELVAPGVAD